MDLLPVKVPADQIQKGNERLRRERRNAAWLLATATPLVLCVWSAIHAAGGVISSGAAPLLALPFVAATPLILLLILRIRTSELRYTIEEDGLRRRTVADARQISSDLLRWTDIEDVVSNETSVCLTTQAGVKHEIPHAIFKDDEQRELLLLRAMRGRLGRCPQS